MKIFDRKRWFFYPRTEKGGFRALLSYDAEGGHRRDFTARTEVVWRRNVGPGFSIRFGNESSETPIDWMISLFWVAIFGSIQLPGLGRFCEWIGRGHKRELSLRFHSGSMWWKLWYNDDGGYDPYHKCDPWKRPTLPPWRWGRTKYRGWMCLRDGHIDLNPLDAIWGSRYFSFTDLEEKTKKLKMKQFPGDEYEVKLTLRQAHRGRRHGPRWIRHYKVDHWTVEWECAGEAIPIRNHDWKGEGILASSERIDSPANWWIKALVSLHKRVERDRISYNYQPPLPWKDVGHMPDTGVTLDEGEEILTTFQPAQDFDGTTKIQLGGEATGFWKGVAEVQAIIDEANGSDLQKHSDKENEDG